MMLSKRIHPSPSHPHPSGYPSNSELASCLSSPDLLASPPITPPRAQKHSLSNPMTWMHRTSSSTSHHSANIPHAAPKPTRISDPKFPSSLDQFSFHRSGPLGSGATVVRTPQEALFGSTNPLDPASEEEGVKHAAPVPAYGPETRDVRFLEPVPSSPPLPPLPDAPDTTSATSGSSARVALADQHDAPPPRTCGSPSPSGRFSSPRPTLLAHSSAASRSTPTLPVDTSSTPPQPPFEAILLSSVPDGPVDPSKLIITLETCTDTYRTSLRTLASRPSHLSRYITTLLSPTSEAASVYSNASAASSSEHKNGFNPFLRDHLASSGCLPPSAGIRLFLDRSSAPYAHVLAYLRSSPSTPEYPETLPRAVQLGSIPGPSPPRIESLLELRDEANYIGLEELEKLCSHEIQRVQRAPVLMHRGHTGSVHSVHTVVERCQSRQDIRPAESGVLKGSNLNGTRGTVSSTLTACESSSGVMLESKDKDMSQATPSVRGRQGSRGIRHEVGSAPPGWI